MLFCGVWFYILVTQVGLCYARWCTEAIELITSIFLKEYIEKYCTDLTLADYFNARISFTLSSHESVPHSKPIKKTLKKPSYKKNQNPKTNRTGFNLKVCHSYFRAEFLISLSWNGINLEITGSLKDGDECVFKLLIIDYNHILIILWTWTGLHAYY